MRLVVVGLDGATFDIIHPLVRQNRLPNLSRLMQEGAWGTLRSTIPPISPTAWTTFATGKNPGKHGVFDFQYLASDYSWQPRPAQAHQHKTLWRLLSEAGHRVAVLDVPFTYPPEAVNGVMISGYPTPRLPDTIFTHPPDLPRRLESAGIQLELGWPKARIDVHPTFFAEWEQVMQARKRLLDQLFHREPWDLFMVVFGITDTLAHTLWHYLDPAHPAYRDERAEAYRETFLKAYEQCDRLLGHLWDKVEEDTHLIVLSDHGFGTIRPRQWVVRFLVDHGWLKFRQPPRTGAVVQPLRNLALRAYTELGWLRRRVRELRPNSKGRLKQALAQGGLLAESSAIDPTTSLVLPSDMGTHLYLNRRSRFRAGLLADQAALKLAEEIRQSLLAAKDPVDGQPVVKAVYAREEIYTGQALAEAPDLVVEYQNRYLPARAAPQPNPNLEGGHVPEGILLAWGPGVEAKSLPETEIVNLAPTMLYLLQEPVPPDMDGELLTNIFRQEWLARQPALWGEEPAVFSQDEARSYTSAEQAEVEEQLRALGYIE